MKRIYNLIEQHFQTMKTIYSHAIGQVMLNCILSMCKRQTFGDLFVFLWFTRHCWLPLHTRGNSMCMNHQVKNLVISCQPVLQLVNWLITLLCQHRIVLPFGRYFGMYLKLLPALPVWPLCLIQ